MNATILRCTAEARRRDDVLRIAPLDIDDCMPWGLDMPEWTALALTFFVARWIPKD